MNNEPIKVLEIIRHMNVGGAETLIMNIYRNIDKSKIQLDFLVTGKGKFDDEIKSLGGKIYYMKYLTDIGQYRYKKQLKKFFKEHSEYKVIHSHIDQVSGIILEAAKESNVPIRIAHSHSTNNLNSMLAKIYKSYLQNKIVKNANCLLACSEESAKWLYKEHYVDAKILENGIDVEKYKFSEENRYQIRNELNIDENATVFGHIGRFSKVKNHDFLIDVFYNYQKSNKNSALVLVGEGPEKENIIKKVKLLNIQDKVFFLGLRMDGYKIYSALDIFLFPSVHEGISLSLIEAQISGLPIYASDKIDIKTNITKTINFLDLDKGYNYWSNQILAKQNNRYMKNFEIIKNSNYNIKNTVEKYENIIGDLGEVIENDH